MPVHPAPPLTGCPPRPAPHCTGCPSRSVRTDGPSRLAPDWLSTPPRMDRQWGAGWNGQSVRFDPPIAFRRCKGIFMPSLVEIGLMVWQIERLALGARVTFVITVSPVPGKYARPGPEVSGNEGERDTSRQEGHLVGSF